MFRDNPRSIHNASAKRSISASVVGSRLAGALTRAHRHTDGARRRRVVSCRAAVATAWLLWQSPKTRARINPEPVGGSTMRDQLGEYLSALEREMRAQARWEQQAPSRDALQSRQPFAVDTLSLDQWLQWIFVPKLSQMLSQQLPLPVTCAVSPMAEEVYGEADAGGQRLIRILAEIDTLLTSSDHNLN